MYDKLTVNNNSFISMNGELICDEYLPEHNPMNPESSFGWFIYLIVGGGFDLMDETSNQYLNDMDIMSCDSKKLDKFYGANLNLPRPKILENQTERLLTDDEYRVYLYVCNSQLLTRLDLLSVFSHCMGDESINDYYNGVSVTKELVNRFHVVDHLHYSSPDTMESNIGINSSSDLNKIVNHNNSSDEVYRINDKRNYSGEYIVYVNVPSHGWSSVFLDFLSSFISIKGNVLIREVIL